MSESFNVILPCKPYVKQFIIHNFGEPADFVQDSEIHRKFLNSLKNPCKRRDNDDKYIKLINNYGDKINVIIHSDYFYRYGWSLSVNDIIDINKILSSRAKLFMRVNLIHLLEGNKVTKEAIREFQEIFDYPEDVWPWQSIKKDFYRNGQTEYKASRMEKIKINQKLFMGYLSLSGTVTEKGVKYYENIQQTT